MLLIHQFEINSQPIKTSKSLIASINSEDYETVKQIVEQYPDSVNTYSGSKKLWWWESIAEIPGVSGYPIQSACYVGNYEIIKFLVENGADCNLVFHKNSGTWYSKSALMIAVIYENEKMVDILMLLLDNGAEKSYKDAFGKTAYDYAVDKGLLEISELLKP